MLGLAGRDLQVIGARLYAPAVKCTELQAVVFYRIIGPAFNFKVKQEILNCLQQTITSQLAENRHIVLSIPCGVPRRGGKKNCGIFYYEITLAACRG